MCTTSYLAHLLGYFSRYELNMLTHFYLSHAGVNIAIQEVGYMYKEMQAISDQLGNLCVYDKYFQYFLWIEQGIFKEHHKTIQLTYLPICLQ